MKERKRAMGKGARKKWGPNKMTTMMITMTRRRNVHVDAVVGEKTQTCQHEESDR
jgi:hypothetical protein